MKRILPIVEGDGDVQAVPTLLRRVLHETFNVYDVQVLAAQKRGELPRVKQEFRRYYLTALLDNAPILWVMDFDCKDCIDPNAERQSLIEQARAIHPEGRLEIVFMVKEFESIFLHDRNMLKSAFPELTDDVQLPAQPETVRDAKGWISQSLPKGRAYKPTVDQARLCAKLDLQQLRTASSSFVQFENAIRALLG